MPEVVVVMICGAFLLLFCCSTAESSCRGDCCAVVMAAHKCSASLWQRVAHFTLTASVFTVINQWRPGGCHFAPCGARLRLGSAPQTHSRPCWGDRAIHAHTRARTRTYTYMCTRIDMRTPAGLGHTHTHTQNYMLSIRQAVGAITETWQNTMKQAPLSEGK